MPAVSGKVYYSQDGYAEIITSPVKIDNSDNPTLGVVYVQPQRLIANMPVVLINSDGKGICVLTSDTGEFKFNNVPAGAYKLIEQFGRKDGLVSPQNFSANDIEMPIPKDPDPKFIESQGYVISGATRIVSLSPNTYNLNISTSNIEHDFIDTPVLDIPFKFSDHRYVEVGENLIKYGEHGTFGTLDEGTASSTSPLNNPYSDPLNSADPLMTYDTNMNYVQYGPAQPDSRQSPYRKYSISNIIDKKTFGGKWFDAPAHETGDERDRMLVVNGDYYDNINPYIFKETITVKPNTQYSFTAWIMNVFRLKNSSLPTFRLEITGEDGSEIAKEDIDTAFPVTIIPTWKQIGRTILADEIKDNTSITVTLINTVSNRDEGNDFCVDDISFKEVRTTTGKPLVDKEANKDEVSENGELEYTVTLSNKTWTDIYNCTFIDALPKGSELIGTNNNLTVLITEDVTDSSNPTTIFTTTIDITSDELSNGKDIFGAIQDEIPESTPYYSSLKEGRIPHGLSLVLKYKIKVPDRTILGENSKVYNTARFDYRAAFDVNEASYPRTVLSDELETKVIYPVVESYKRVWKSINGKEIEMPCGAPSNCGDSFIYKILIKNVGTEILKDASVKDTLDPLLWPLNAEEASPESWAGSISKQIGETEEFLASGDINADESNRNSLTLLLKDIDIQASEECVIKIYTKVKCDGI